jgi:hypothetical protein
MYGHEYKEGVCASLENIPNRRHRTHPQVASDILTVGLILAFSLLSCGNASTGNTPPPPPPPTSKFPLKVGPTSRYLVDQQDKPFLLIGDAPQALMVNVSTSDAATLLADRASRGFNAVWIMLLCNDYSGGRSDATTYDGVAPFTTAGDFSTPNETYFSRCDTVINSAKSNGLTVILDPIDTGGFISVIASNGLTKCEALGEYLGNRYKDFDNIIWMSGSDFQLWTTPSDDAVVKAIASGIKAKDTRHIQTLELSYYVSSSLDDPNWADIVTLNAAYTYYPAYDELLKDYNRTPIVPAFLIETDYEGENAATLETLRRQEYWTFLGGGCGHVFGNHYVWALRSGWQNNLDTPGVREFGYCRALLQTRAWQSLVPDQGHILVTAGYGTYFSNGNPHLSITANDYVTAAATPDGALALAYVPSSRSITVDLTRMSGSVNARWYDPTAGTYQSISGSPFANTGSQTFSTPGTHADGASDWVLVLEKQ